MGSTAFDVNVQEIKEKTIILNIKVVNPDYLYIEDSYGFALLLLHEETKIDDPLGMEVDVAEVYDNKWIQKYARGFIKSVEVVKVENEPPEDINKLASDHPYWENRDEWLSWQLKIEVTDTAWIQHLSEGHVWSDSRAFEPCSYYDECESILHEIKVDELIETPKEEGLLPVWKYFYYNHIGKYREDVIWIPKYSRRAYIPIKTYSKEKITPEILKELEGSLIVTNSMFVSDKVVFFWIDEKGKGRFFFTSSGGGSGSSSFGLEKLPEKISTVAFNPNSKRLGTPLTIDMCLNYASPLIINTHIEGNTATLTVISFREDKKLSLLTTTECLALLAKPIYDLGDYKGYDSPLVRLLECQKGNSGVCNTFGGGIIVSWEVNAPNKKNPDLARMSTEELIEHYNFDHWPQWQIKIVVTDPAWIQHLDNYPIYAYDFGYCTAGHIFSMSTGPNGYPNEIATLKDYKKSEA